MSRGSLTGGRACGLASPALPQAFHGRAWFGAYQAGTPSRPQHQSRRQIMRSGCTGTPFRWSRLIASVTSNSGRQRTWFTPGAVLTPVLLIFFSLAASGPSSGQLTAIDDTVNTQWHAQTYNNAYFGVANIHESSQPYKYTTDGQSIRFDLGCTSGYTCS